jgi:serine/threonine protein kinase
MVSILMPAMSNYPAFSSQPYQVIRELGRNREGGRISYLAECLKAKQQVVIKQFRFAQENANWAGFKTYEREISILQALTHPRIPRYLDSFETLDGFCMVQEYKDAPTLATVKSLLPKVIEKILVSILEILVDIQQSIPPVIHRDIKPENILVDKDNQAYLIDFGLARINSQEVALSSVMAGTPGFMPPEELFGRPLTTGSDLYSLGATAIAMLTNTAAADVSTLIDENYQFKFRHLVTGINPDFLDWLEKMVAPNLKDRYANAEIALQTLKTIDITGKARFQPQKTHRNSIGTRIFGGILGLTGLLMLSALSRAGTHMTTDNSGIQPHSSGGKQWFDQIKASCNPVEVTTAIISSPYPQTTSGVGYAASCYALAGKIDLADQVIQQLPPNRQEYAARVVFEIGHPVADAGDDKSAGEIMELVVRYWGDNYMALYHAGMSAYILQDYPKATAHLQAFLKVYQQPDAWTDRAKSALSRMEQGIPADESFSVRH